MKRSALPRALDPEHDGPLSVLVGAVKRYLDDDLYDRAPTLAYYGIFSLFPTLLLTFSILRLLGGDGAPDDLARYANEHGASGAVSDVLRQAANTAREAPAPSAGAAGLIGLATIIYGASRAFTASGRAFDVVHRRGSVQRSLLRRAQDIGWTLVLLALTIVVLVLIVVSGRVLEDLLGVIGLSGDAIDVWAVVRLPAAAVLALIVVDIVAWASPTQRVPFRILSAGRLVTVAGLAVATAGFGVYVTELASYNATYGAFAGSIILLLWIWLAGTALLFGAEVDAELEARRQRRGPPG